MKHGSMPWVDRASLRDRRTPCRQYSSLMMTPLAFGLAIVALVGLVSVTKKV